MAADFCPLPPFLASVTSLQANTSALTAGTWASSTFGNCE